MSKSFYIGNLTKKQMLFFAENVIDGACFLSYNEVTQNKNFL